MNHRFARDYRRIADNYDSYRYDGVVRQFRLARTLEIVSVGAHSLFVWPIDENPSVEHVSDDVQGFDSRYQ